MNDVHIYMFTFVLFRKCCNYNEYFKYLWKWMI